MFVIYPLTNSLTWKMFTNIHLAFLFPIHCLSLFCLNFVFGLVCQPVLLLVKQTPHIYKHNRICTRYNVKQNSKNILRPLKQFSIPFRPPSKWPYTIRYMSFDKIFPLTTCIHLPFYCFPFFYQWNCFTFLWQLFSVLFFVPNRKTENFFFSFVRTKRRKLETINSATTITAFAMKM